jgi:hypothetical protein
VSCTLPPSKLQVLQDLQITQLVKLAGDCAKRALEKSSLSLKLTPEQKQRVVEEVCHIARSLAGQLLAAQHGMLAVHGSAACGPRVHQDVNREDRRGTAPGSAIVWEYTTHSWADERQRSFE